MRLLYALLVIFILSTCQPKRYAIQQHQTLLFGSDEAIYAGCVRGVLRWHYERTGAWLTPEEVQLFCIDVQRSFQPVLNRQEQGKT